MYTAVHGRDFLDNPSLGLKSGFITEETHLTGLAPIDTDASKSVGKRSSSPISSGFEQHVAD